MENQKRLWNKRMRILNNKKIGQVSAEPNGLGIFVSSPNLLIWLLDK